MRLPSPPSLLLSAPARCSTGDHDDDDDDEHDGDESFLISFHVFAPRVFPIDYLMQDVFSHSYLRRLIRCALSPFLFSLGPTVEIFN
jgi:hypothetical protein